LVKFKEIFFIHLRKLESREIHTAKEMKVSNHDSMSVASITLKHLLLSAALQQMSCVCCDNT